MRWNLVSLDSVQPTPWKNGGGSTRELLAWPGAQDWRVRCSVAEVAQAGPFSSFPGVQRWFAVLSGAGVRLQMGDVSHVLDGASPPLAFDGGAAVDCALLKGATQDFNLMVRGASARMERVRGGRFGPVNAPDLIAIYAGSTGATAEFGSETAAIPPHTLAWRRLVAGGQLKVLGEDALWMEVSQ
ncbi:HutD family protein [uncultured Ramlibacter sp.]|uniref:HutD/Ves family protein n=1 Tax=uncultured Ramlibacter sp. TaxID=260755 RepID=UPI0026327006|nr:HutD family protein [uncultured Ramlibacter sp.]